MFIATVAPMNNLGRLKESFWVIKNGDYHGPTDAQYDWPPTWFLFFQDWKGKEQGRQVCTGLPGEGILAGAPMSCEYGVPHLFRASPVFFPCLPVFPMPVTSSSSSGVRVGLSGVAV
jgi:hypothetical protein